MLDFVAGIFPSCRRRSRFAVDRDDGPLAFEEMAEPEDRWLSVLEIMSGGYRDAAMAQLLAGGENAVSLIESRLPNSFRNVCNGFFDLTPLERSQPSSASICSSNDRCHRAHQAGGDDSHSMTNSPLRRA